jgi:hypothetical protein
MAKNRKRREEDDDDFEDRPRRRKGGNGLIFVLVGVGVLVVLGAVVAVVLVTRDKKPDSPPATETAKADTKGTSPTPNPSGPTPPNNSGLPLVPSGPSPGNPTPGNPFPKQPTPQQEPTGGAVLNEANFRKIRQNMTRAEFEGIFGKPLKANPTPQDRATYLLGEPTWTHAVNQAGPVNGYNTVMYAEGNVGMEANFRVHPNGAETINGAQMTMRSGPPSKGAVHIELIYFNIDGKITRHVDRYGPGGTRQ